MGETLHTQKIIVLCVTVGHGSIVGLMFYAFDHRVCFLVVAHGEKNMVFVLTALVKKVRGS